MSLFTEFELLIMGSVLGFLILLVLILVISEIVSHRKNKKIELMEDEIDDVKEEISLLEETTSQVSVEATLTPVLEIKEVEEEIQEIKVEETENVVVEAVEPLIEELDPVIVKIETEEEKNMDSREKAQIELLKVEEELGHEFSLEDTITNLEAIEEENAIISYQELLSNTAELEVVTCDDDGDEPITMDEVFKMFQNQTDEGIDITEMLSSVPLSEAYQGNFSETPYLSPINGIEGESLTEIQLENTANLEKLEKEIRKTNEFLNILNELKKNLE